jgi:hypothetical protein
MIIPYKTTPEFGIMKGMLITSVTSVQVAAMRG